jgi:hypothetical protein
MKQPVEFLLKEVDKMYDNNMNLKSNQEIEAFCDHVTHFIEACGYTTDDYVRLIMNVSINNQYN